MSATKRELQHNMEVGIKKTKLVHDQPQNEIGLANPTILFLLAYYIRDTDWLSLSQTSKSLLASILSNNLLKAKLTDVREDIQGYPCPYGTLSRQGHRTLFNFNDQAQKKFVATEDQPDLPSMMFHDLYFWKQYGIALGVQREADQEDQEKEAIRCWDTQTNQQLWYHTWDHKRYSNLRLQTIVDPQTQSVWACRKNSEGDCITQWELSTGNVIQEKLFPVAMPDKLKHEDTKHATSLALCESYLLIQDTTDGSLKFVNKGNMEISASISWQCEEEEAEESWDSTPVGAIAVDHDEDKYYVAWGYNAAINTAVIHKKDFGTSRQQVLHQVHHSLHFKVQEDEQCDNPCYFFALHKALLVIVFSCEGGGPGPSGLEIKHCESGEQLLVFNEKSEWDFFMTPPAIYGDTLYVAYGCDTFSTCSGKLSAFSLASFQTKWTRAFELDQLDTDGLVAFGSIVVGPDHLYLQVQSRWKSAMYHVDLAEEQPDLHPVLVFHEEQEKEERDGEKVEGIAMCERIDPYVFVEGGQTFHRGFAYLVEEGPNHKLQKLQLQ